MLKPTMLILVMTVSLLVVVGAVALAEGKAGSSEGEVGVGPTQLLANGAIDPGLA